MSAEDLDPSPRRRLARPEQLDLFRALPGDLAPRDAQDLMAYPFFSLAKSKRLTPIDFKAGAITIRVEATPEHGMATIWDADVLIWAASQIVHARDAGLRTSRLMASTPYEILTFVGRGSARATISGSRRASTGFNRPPSRPRSAKSPNVVATVSPGSTNGRRRPTPAAGRSGSRLSCRTGSTPGYSTTRSF